MISLSYLLFLTSVKSQNKISNPFESIGKEVEILTLTKGKYQEHFENDTLQRIGNVIYNAILHKIEFIVSDSVIMSEDGMDMYIVSRFLTRDPLERYFAYYSPYQFAGNSPIAFIDLDGKERVLAITFNGDVNYRAAKLEKLNGSEISKKVLTTNPGKQIAEAMVEASSKDEKGIAFVAIWGHGVPSMMWGTDAGFLNKDDLEYLKKEVEAGNIKFSDNAVIYIGNCNAGTCEEDNDSFAQQIADITGVTVIAGSADDINEGRPHKGSVGVNKAEGGEEEGDMKYTMYFPKIDNFKVFTKYAEPKKIGGTISLNKWLVRSKVENIGRVEPIKAKNIETPQPSKEIVTPK